MSAAARSSEVAGFSLIEVLVALIVSVVALLVALGLLADCVRLSVELRSGAKQCRERWNRVQEIRSGVGLEEEPAEWFLFDEGGAPIRCYWVGESESERWEVFQYDGSAPAGQ